VNGSVDSSPRPGDHNDLQDYRERYVDHGDSGYYYVLVTTEAAFQGDDYYAGSGVDGAAVAESFDSPKITSSLLMHELGHAFGLGPAEVGVDEETFDASEYRSVMNYNALYEVETYSDGSGEVGRDEWAFVTEDRYRPRSSVWRRWDGRRVCGRLCRRPVITDGSLAPVSSRASPLKETAALDTV